MVHEHVAQRTDAFYVVDLKEVARKYAEWRAHLPRVRPFYAVKCNDDPRIVETLHRLGTGFDCASKGEMAMALSAGVKPEDIIFAHPAKQATHLHYARAKGVVRMTFDNAEELRKIAREHPGAEVVLRILTDDSHSVCRLGLKFGAPLSSVRQLFTLAKELGLKAVGVSYHVGSGNGDAASFGSAVRDARTAFDIAAAEGIKLSLLDIGGGFPGSELGCEDGSDKLVGAVADAGNPYSKHPSFATIAGVVREALDTYFPEGCGVNIISEPGRFFVKSSHVLAVNVVGKRETVDEETGGKRINYYVNDGLYGSFNCVMYDHVTCAPSMVLSEEGSETMALAAARVAIADDALARMGEDGQPIMADSALGMEAAELLRDAMEPVARDEEEVDVEEQVMMKRMTADGNVELDASSVLSALSMAMGSSASGAARRMTGGASAAASAAVSSATSCAGSASTSARRNFSYAPLAGAATAPVTGAQLVPTTLWGPTCDSIDKISDAVPMPELKLGDWLVYENMGAYTIAGSCKFNGFPLTTKVYLNTDDSITVMAEEVHE